MRPRPSVGAWHHLMAVVGCLLLAGCVERTLLIRTDPPGAKVIVNGSDRGPSPVTVRYVRDGRFDVRVEKEGYESVQTEVETPTRADAVPGIDFFAENLYPGTIRRQTLTEIRMAPLVPEAYTRDAMRAVLDRADAFRRRAEAEVAEPGTPQPARTPNPAPAPNR